jgi:RNase adaptor protein for sRNA GlmZ degradation
VRDPDYSEGKAYLRIAVCCSGGRYRPVYFAARLTERLSQSGLRVEVAHRDLPPGTGPPPALPDKTAGETG